MIASRHKFTACIHMELFSTHRAHLIAPSALHLAAENGNCEAVDKLLSNGSDVKREDPNHVSAALWRRILTILAWPAIVNRPRLPYCRAGAHVCSHTSFLAHRNAK